MRRRRDFAQFRNWTEKYEKAVKRNWDYMKSKHWVAKHNNEGHRTWSVGQQND